MDDLNGLPYLDAVVRETLRFYPPIPSTARAAKKDDCIPLSKPFTDKKGIVHNEIRLASDSILMLLYSNLKLVGGSRIRKGQAIDVPIFLINRDKSIWGEDSTEFKLVFENFVFHFFTQPISLFRPERWAGIPDAVQSIPGVWANIMTFFGGPRACIGYRFSLLE